VNEHAGFPINKIKKLRLPNKKALHVVKVPQFFISFIVGVGENDIFIFPLFPMCSHHIAYNLAMGSH
jgi:hypothetical protein